VLQNLKFLFGQAAVVASRSNSKTLRVFEMRR